MNLTPHVLIRILHFILNQADLVITCKYAGLRQMVIVFLGNMHSRSKQCQKMEFRYRAGIQFISLHHAEEEYLRQQIEGSQQCKSLPDPKQVVATLIDSIRKDLEGNLNSQPPAIFHFTLP